MTAGNDNKIIPTMRDFIALSNRIKILEDKIRRNQSGVINIPPVLYPDAVAFEFSFNITPIVQLSVTALDYVDYRTVSVFTYFAYTIEITKDYFRFKLIPDEAPRGAPFGKIIFQLHWSASEQRSSELRTYGDYLPII